MRRANSASAGSRACGGNRLRSGTRTRLGTLRRRCNGASAIGSGGNRSIGSCPTALEIGGIPARALELETGRSQLLLEGRSATAWTLGQLSIRHFLQYILGKPAGLAFIGINWHGNKARIWSSKALYYKASLSKPCARRPARAQSAASRPIPTQSRSHHTERLATGD